MATDAQRRANGINARKSTGPRTAAGKARSARNALRHGFFCEKAWCGNEQARAEYAALLDETLKAMRPANPVQQCLVESIVLYAWRIRGLVEQEREQARYEIGAAYTVQEGFEKRHARVMGLLLRTVGKLEAMQAGEEDDDASDAAGAEGRGAGEAVTRNEADCGSGAAKDAAVTDAEASGGCAGAGEAMGVGAEDGSLRNEADSGVVAATPAADGIVGNEADCGSGAAEDGIMRNEADSGVVATSGVDGIVRNEANSGSGMVGGGDEAEGGDGERSRFGWGEAAGTG